MNKALIVLMAAALPVGWGLVCPTFTCADLPVDSCAVKVDEKSVLINNASCSAGKFCSGERLYQDWWFASTTGIGTTYPCLNETTFVHLTTVYKDNYAHWACYGREAGKDLETGFHPKDCASDKDCRLVDGSLSSCQCGFRASGYFNSTMGVCQPDMSSSVFNNYWKQCDSAGYVESTAIGFYYKVMHDFYPILQSPPVSCASSVIWEFQLLATALQESLASGFYLMLAGWSALY